MKLFARITIFFLKSLLALSGIIILNYVIIFLATWNSITTEAADLKDYHHVLIPGAGNSPLGEWQNPTFSARMNSCLELSNQVRLSRVVCSGMVKPPYYNEPTDMKDFLIKKKLPEAIIEIDEHGNNTRQTIYNYAEKYPGDSVVIISQRLHLSRAIFAAKYYGLNARGFSAGKYERFQNEFVIYEALSRMKLTFELLFK